LLTQTVKHAHESKQRSWTAMTSTDSWPSTNIVILSYSVEFASRLMVMLIAGDFWKSMECEAQLSWKCLFTPTFCWYEGFWTV